MEADQTPRPLLGWIGTSGFSYGDWKGSFYPDWMPSRDWFHYYSTQFNAVEINQTFYRPATPIMLQRLEGIGTARLPVRAQGEPGDHPSIPARRLR